MPFDSARPVEYDSYVPNSLQLDQHTLSDGPYQISSYIPGKSITLVRNPAWKQSTDSLRHDYVNEIVDTAGRDLRPDPAVRLAGRHPGRDRQRHADQPVVDPVAGGVQGLQLRDLAGFRPVPVHRVQPAQPGRERRRGQAAGAPGHRVRPGQVGRGEGHRRAGRRHDHQHGDPAGQRRLRELQPVPGRQRAGQHRHVQDRPDQGRVPARRHA